MKTANADTIIFLHLPKTAGTTLNHVIDRQYAPEQIFFFGPNTHESLENYRTKPDEEKRQIKLISGHFPFGIHKQVPGTSTYFTILREPIKRVVSFFNYIKHTDAHYLNETVIGKSTDLVSFMEQYTTQMADNAQTRLISGVWLDVPYGKCTAEMYEMAKFNLRDNFSVIGLTKRFDETLLLLRAAFNWQDIRYLRQNVSRSKPAQKSISEKEREAIVHYNQWDIALYEYAQTLFAKQITAQGPGFQKELQEFKRQNQNPHKLRVWQLMNTAQKAKEFSVRTYFRRLFSR